VDPDQLPFCRLDSDPGGQKCPTKNEKSEEISWFEVLDVVF
jgi:hypothetical protein